MNKNDPIAWMLTERPMLICSMEIEAFQSGMQDADQSRPAIAHRAILYNLRGNTSSGSGNRARRRDPRAVLAMRTSDLDCSHVMAELEKKGVSYQVLAEDIARDCAPGFGGTVLIAYVRPSTGEITFCFEVNAWYAGDAYGSTQFFFGTRPSEADCAFAFREKRARGKGLAPAKRRVKVVA